MKLVLGAVLAGLAMFVWGFVAHTLLPLGMAGLQSVPEAQEKALGEALKASLSEHSLYWYPAFDPSQMGDEAVMEAYEAKVAAGPNALIVYNPGAGVEYGAKPMLVELASNILACLVAALVVAKLAAGASYWPRVIVVAAFGLFSALSIEASYWNWYDFPIAYTAAQFIDQIAGALVSGLVLAAFVAPRS